MYDTGLCVVVEEVGCFFSVGLWRSYSCGGRTSRRRRHRRRRHRRRRSSSSSCSGSGSSSGSSISNSSNDNIDTLV